MASISEKENGYSDSILEQVLDCKKFVDHRLISSRKPDHLYYQLNIGLDKMHFRQVSQILIFVLLFSCSLFSCQKEDEGLAPNIISTRWSMIGDVINLNYEFEANREVFVTETSIFQNPPDIVESGTYNYSPPNIEIFVNELHEVGIISGDSLILPSGVFIKQ